MERRILDASSDLSQAWFTASSLHLSLRMGLLERIDEFGFAVARLPQPPLRRELLTLSELFGGVWRHARSDPDGVAPIEVDENTPQFLGTSSDAHPPHSDGAYSPGPPCLVVLSCEEATAPGGESVLISSRNLYEKLRRQAPEALRTLFRSDALVIERQHHSVTTPAFSRHDDRIRLVYRYDKHSRTRTAPAARQAFALLREYVAEPASRLVMRLERGDVLFIDNFGMLHGRERFDARRGRRRLLRLNFTGSSLRCPQIFGFPAAGP